MPAQLLALVPVAAALVAAAWWVYRAQHRLDLYWVPQWWQWPLWRIVVHLWKLEAHKDLFKVCGWSRRDNNIDVPTRGATRYISIGHRDGKPWVKVRVAPGFDQGDEETDAVQNAKQRVVNQARGTLDLGPVDYRWDFRFWRRHVILTPKELVPKEAPGSRPDIAAVVAANLTPTAVVPAIGKGDRPVIHDADDDAPHVLISGTTNGGGKTSTLRTFGIQYYSTGADLLIVDTIRQFSHVGWAIDPDTHEPWPGIFYADTLEDAAAWIIQAGKVMVQRGEITKQAMLRGDTVEWPRAVILLDDMNGTQAELKRQGYDEASHYLSLLLWASRGVAMNIIAAFQRGSARAAGGGDNREAYGLRIWADGSAKTGDMLADAVDRKKRPQPKPHTIQPGHSVFIYGSYAFEAQRIFYTDDEARAVCATEAARRRRHAIDATSSEHEDQRDRYQATPQQAIAAGHRNGGSPTGHQQPATQREADEGQHQQDHQQRRVMGHGSGSGPQRPHDLSVGFDPSVHVVDGPAVLVDGASPASVTEGKEPVGGVGGGHGSRLSSPTTLPPVNTTVNPLDDGDREGKPEDPGVMGSDPQTHPATTLRPPTTPKAPHSGFSLPVGGVSSMQEMDAVSRIDDVDSGINYLTLRDLAGREWCPYTYETVRKYARDDSSFPAPVEGFENPRRWSESAVRDWFESRVEDAGAPGVYVIEPPHDLKVKIGETKRLAGRIDEFSWSGLPQEELVRHWFPCRSKRHAQELEGWFRRKYRTQRIAGTEWHKKEGTLVADLGDDAAMLRGCPAEIRPLEEVRT